MRILIYGAVNIGCLYAAKLTQSGQDVTVLARGDRYNTLREHGVTLEDGVSGESTTTAVPVVDRGAGGVAEAGAGRGAADSRRIGNLRDQPAQCAGAVVQRELRNDALAVFGQRLVDAGAQALQQAGRGVGVEHLHQRAGRADVGCEGAGELRVLLAELAAQHGFQLAVFLQQPVDPLAEAAARRVEVGGKRAAELGRQALAVCFELAAEICHQPLAFLADGGRVELAAGLAQGEHADAQRGEREPAAGAAFGVGGQRLGEVAVGEVVWFYGVASLRGRWLSDGIKGAGGRLAV